MEYEPLPVQAIHTIQNPGSIEDSHDEQSLLLVGDDNMFIGATYSEHHRYWILLVTK